jgi:hypothetical protein
MKLTLLDMVQRVLESIGSDSVNSIGDTEESTEAAYIIRDVYLEMLSTRDWPHLKKTSTLTSLGSTSKPTHFDIPEDTQEIIPDTLKYNVSETVTPEWKALRYLTPEQFLDLSAGRAGDSNTQTVQDNVPLYIYDNVAPTYWTTFNQTQVILDSYDSDVENTTQTSKTQCILLFVPDFDIQDDFIPNLPDRWFTNLLAESKSVAAVQIAQEANPKAEQQSRRTRAYSSRASGVYQFTNRPDYGR